MSRPQARDRIVDSGVRLPGDYESNVIPLRDATRAVRVSIPRCTTQDATMFSESGAFITVRLLVSFDGGATWRNGGAFGTWGGVHIRRDGKIADASEMTVPLPAGSNRLLRVRVTPQTRATRCACDIEELR